MGSLIKELLRLVRSEMMPAEKRKYRTQEARWRSSRRASASSIGRLFSEIG